MNNDEKDAPKPGVCSKCKVEKLNADFGVDDKTWAQCCAEPEYPQHKLIYETTGDTFYVSPRVFDLVRQVDRVAERRLALAAERIESILPEPWYLEFCGIEADRPVARVRRGVGGQYTEVKRFLVDLEGRQISRLHAELQLIGAALDAKRGSE